MILPRPVTDWMRDFDHNDPRWVDDPYALWREMRAVGGVARTGRYGGVHLPLSWAGVRHVASTPDDFSSQEVEIREGRQLPPDFAPPITSDPPLHGPARRLLARHLSTSRVAALRSEARLDCRALIADFAHTGAVDAVAGYARPAVSRTLSRVLGMAAEDIVTFQSLPFDDRMALIRTAISTTRPYAQAGLVAHLVQAAKQGEIDGEVRLIGHIYLLLIAGLDTTAAVISTALLHLAENDGDRVRLRDHSEDMPAAIEEFLRLSAPVSTARVAMRDMDIQGCPIASGEKVLLAFAAANRDPTRFDNPDHVVLDRPIQPHAAFGFGIHHCAGSKLARMLISVALQEWLLSIAHFKRSDYAPLEWITGSVRSIRHLPLKWNREKNFRT